MSYKKKYVDLKREDRTKYSPAYDELARRFKLLGASETVIGDALGVTAATIGRWRKTFESFDLACRQGELDADARVAEALYNKAVGMTVTEQIAMKVKKGKDLEEVEIVEVEKAIPPDTAAQSFWLRNRSRTKWRTDPEPDGENLAPPRDIRIIFVTPPPVSDEKLPMKTITPAFVDVTPKGTADD